MRMHTAGLSLLESIHGVVVLTELLLERADQTLPTVTAPFPLVNCWSQSWCDCWTVCLVKFHPAIGKGLLNNLVHTFIEKR